jgi:endonuclease/exonuclease/phosphatase family metal-dependent hydrolase
MATSFTVMTWNVENLFLAGSTSGPSTPEILDRKLTNLAQTIRLIRPDVLALQEVGDPATLAQLQERLGRRYRHAQLSSHPDRRGCRVGFLSRFGLEEAEELVDFPPTALRQLIDSTGEPVTALRRGALAVTANVRASFRPRLVTAHLKSKLITYPGGRFSPRDEDERARETGLALLVRAAEAVALRVFVNRLVTGNDRPLVLLGDLNDGPEALTTQLLLGPEDRSLAHRDRFDDVRLYNLADYIPPTRRFSRMHNRKQELIDHILVSHELILAQRRVDSFIEPIEAIGDNPARRRDAVFPDHAPVYARFEVE